MLCLRVYLLIYFPSFPSQSLLFQILPSGLRLVAKDLLIAAVFARQLSTRLIGAFISVACLRKWLSQTTTEQCIRRISSLCWEALCNLRLWCYIPITPCEPLTQLLQRNHCGKRGKYSSYYWPWFKQYLWYRLCIMFGIKSFSSLLLSSTITIYVLADVPQLLVFPDVSELVEILSSVTHQLQITPSTNLTWSSCFDGFNCSRLDVSSMISCVPFRSGC